MTGMSKQELIDAILKETESRTTVKPATIVLRIERICKHEQRGEQCNAKSNQAYATAKA